MIYKMLGNKKKRYRLLGAMRGREGVVVMEQGVQMPRALFWKVRAYIEASALRRARRISIRHAAPCRPTPCPSHLPLGTPTHGSASCPLPSRVRPLSR
jgi:hypothetical protein